MNRRAIATPAAFRATAGAIALALLAACGSEGATGTDATPASVVATGNTPASAVIASPVNPAPAVLVTNESGAPLPNVRVTFIVSAGNGQVAGGSQLTNASGIATVGGWTLGTTVGPQTLTANAGGKTVTFTVNATNTCVLTGPIASGATVTGNLAASPCAMGDGTAAQSWSFTQGAGQSNVSFQMHSTGAPDFDSVLLLHRNSFSAFNAIIAFNDDATATTTDSRMDVILGPGDYVVSGANYEPGVTGGFTISATSWDGELAGCADVFVTPGITTTQRMDSSCVYPATTQTADPIYLYIAQGQQVQIDMTSTAFDPALDLYGSSSTPLVQDDNGGGGTSSRIVFTSPAAGIYLVVATSRALGRVGAYTFTVTSLSGAPVGAALTAPAGARRPARLASLRGAAPFGVMPKATAAH